MLFLHLWWVRCGGGTDTRGDAMIELAVVGAWVERSFSDQIVAGRAMDGTSDPIEEG